MSKHVNMGPTADSTPYDNDDCTLKADTVKEGLDELCNRQDAPTLIKVNCDDLSPVGCKPVAFKFTELVNQNLCEITKVEC